MTESNGDKLRKYPSPPARWIRCHITIDGDPGEYHVYEVFVNQDIADPYLRQTLANKFSYRISDAVMSALSSEDAVQKD
jgi:hypothetical protein